MTSAGRRRGGLRKRVRPFTPTPNDTIDDFTISFRALGLLLRILRMPEGFVIRSEQLANEGQGKTRRGRGPEREGRGAVRTALRELALGGYYRLEKVRWLDGTFTMQNAVAEDPDPLWAEQAAAFGARAVTLYEQPDGSLMVRYPDGTMQPDGFPPPRQALTCDDGGDNDGGGDPDTEDEEEEIPGTGFRSPVSRSPRKAAPGGAETGEAAPLSKSGYQDGHQDSVPAPQGRPGRAFQGTIDGNDEPLDGAQHGGPPDPRDVAKGIARVWIDYWAHPKRNSPIGGAAEHVLHAKMTTCVLGFLTRDYTKDEIGKALNLIQEPTIPTTDRLQRALGEVRGVLPAPSRGGPRQARRSGADVESEWSDVRTPAARNDKTNGNAEMAFASASTGGASEW